MIGRRHILLGAAASSVMSLSAWSQQSPGGHYPVKPVRIVVPYAAGTAADTIARQVAQVLGQRLGQPVVVDNRAGANGAIGTAEGAKAAPDGYTLTLGVHGPLAMNPHLYRKLPYAPSDFVGVAGLIQAMYFLTASPTFPANTIPELIAEAKRRPGAIDYGTYGVGSGSHLAGESLNLAAGIQLNGIHYKSVPIPDVVSGVLQLSFDTYVVAAPFLKEGRVKVLAVTSARRNPSFPDIPAISEFIPGYEVAPWIGLFAPKGTPRPVVERLHKEVAAALETETLRASIASTGSVALPLGPEELDRLVTKDWADAKKIAEATKMSLD